MTAGATAPTTGDRLDALARSDKWYLSCGDGIVWAPPFPQWLSHPGFWDEALVYYHPFAPLFTVALVGPTGEAAALERGPLDWRPDGLTVRWRAQRTELIERRFALPGGEFVSHWEPAGATEWPSSLRDWHLVAFSVQPWETVQSLRRDDALPLRLIREIGGEAQPLAPGHRVVSPMTAARVGQLLVGVVQNGTGGRARPDRATSTTSTIEGCGRSATGTSSLTPAWPRRSIGCKDW